MKVGDIAYSEEDKAYTYTYDIVDITGEREARPTLTVGTTELGSIGGIKANNESEALMGELVGFTPGSDIMGALAMEMIGQAAGKAAISVSVVGAVMDLTQSYDTTVKAGEIVKINDGNTAMNKLHLYYVSAVDVKSGQYVARVYPRPDTIHLVEVFNNEYLDSENQITIQEARTDPVRTSEKLKTVPIHVQEAYKEIIQNLGAEENNNAEE